MSDFLSCQESSRAFTVKEITRLIKNTLEGGFFNLWVEGEVSNCKKTSAGHIYFTLKDDSSQISAVMFRSSAVKFKDSLNGGVKVRAYGNISVYEKAGTYQLVCSKVEKIGLGELQLEFLKLKEKLFKMGWFEVARKKSIPYIPEKIALVTSPHGAAVRDMLNIIFTRWPDMKVLVYPVKVQGEGAAVSIANAIGKINEQSLASVIITGRGGGSLEDLWAFNEMATAKAIYESQIPVISAVGHEVDFSISDFVADLRAETPSAAAVAVVPVKADILENLEFYRNSISERMFRKIEKYREKLTSFRNHYCFREPFGQIRQLYQRLDDLTGILRRAVYFEIEGQKETLKRLEVHLRSLSPFAILNRGYSITINSETGETLRQAKEIAKEQKILTILAEGKLTATVDEIFPSQPS